MKPVADILHIKQNNQINNTFDVWVTYKYLGIIPAPSKIFGKNLTRNQVEELRVPFCKIQIYNNKIKTPMPKRFYD